MLTKSPYWLQFSICWRPSLASHLFAPHAKRAPLLLQLLLQEREMLTLPAACMVPNAKKVGCRGWSGLLYLLFLGVCKIR